MRRVALVPDWFDEFVLLEALPEVEFELVPVALLEPVTPTPAFTPPTPSCAPAVTPSPEVLFGWVVLLLPGRNGCAPFWLRLCSRAILKRRVSPGC